MAATSRQKAAPEPQEPRLSFAATLEGVAVQPVKAQKDYGGKITGYAGGAIKVIATIERPLAPKKLTGYVPSACPSGSSRTSRRTRRRAGRCSSGADATEILRGMHEAAKRAYEEMAGNVPERLEQGARRERRGLRGGDREASTRRTTSARTKLERGARHTADDNLRSRAATTLAELTEHEAAIAAMPGQLQAFGTLAGLGALLQGATVRIELTPDQESVEQLLPGFHPLGLLTAAE